MPSDPGAPLKAVILNCTKKSPEVSNTEALIRKVVALMEAARRRERESSAWWTTPSPSAVESDHGTRRRVAGHPTRACGRPTSSSSAPPSGLGCGAPSHSSSSSGSTALRRGRPAHGPFPLYGKVAGVIVTGNEDGAHDAAATTHVQPRPPGAAWCRRTATATGSATRAQGRATSRPAATSTSNTNKTARYLAHNAVFMARLLREHPIPTDLNALIAEATAESRGRRL